MKNFNESGARILSEAAETDFVPLGPPVDERPWELVVSSGSQAGTVFSLTAFGARVGSGDDCNLRLLDASVAPAHAAVQRREDGSFWVTSQAPHGATLLNGDAVHEAPLFEGADFQFGLVHLRVRKHSVTGLHDTAMAMEAEPIPLTREVDDSLKPGDLLADRYRVLEKIGEGGMGNVYRAEHLVLRKHFAIKVLRRSMSSNPGFVKRFEREAISASQIRHQNIVDVVDFGRTLEGQLYFVMEYLAGETLARMISRTGPLPIVRVLHIAAQMCRALIAAHERGILHRDIKPENVVLLQREGQPDFVKVVDFGIARMDEGLKDAVQTQVGTIMGTPQYMSPEQAAGLEHDLRSDIYSLGVLLFEIVAGHPPFVGPSPTHVLAAHIMKPPPPLPQVTTAGPIPLALVDLVARMLAKGVQDRPQTMLEVSAIIDHCLVELGQVPSATPTVNLQLGPITWPPRNTAALASIVPTPAKPEVAPGMGSSRTRWIAALGFGAIALTASVGFYVVANRPTPPARPAPVLLPRTAMVPPPVVRAEPVVAGEPIPRAEPRVEVLHERVELTLLSKPSGVQVFDGAALLGRTPLKLKWDAGKEARLRFESAGFKPRLRVLKPSRNTEVSVTLAKKTVRLRDEVDDLKDSPY